MQQSQYNEDYNIVRFRPDSVSQYIIRDKNLCLSARGLLLEIIQLPNRSNLSFEDLYKHLHNEQNKFELIRAFKVLQRCGYIAEAIEIDDKKGPVDQGRCAPLRLLLTEHAKRLRWKH